MALQPMWKKVQRGQRNTFPDFEMKKPKKGVHEREKKEIGEAGLLYKS